jgi:succinate-semialdehyde dehydrogenase/glutarate-semialdehyde dehydrogenase
VDANETFFTVNPATGQKIKNYSRPTWSEALQALAMAEKDFLWWRKQSFSDRAVVLYRLAQELRAQKSTLATSMTEEMGKLKEEALAEIEKCAKTCEFYAQNAANILQNQKILNTPYAEAEISFQPLGVILSIMPWNFPLWQALRFAAPALMAGNVIMMKHADLTAGTASLLEHIFSGLSGEHQLMRVLNMDHEMTARLMAERSIRGVTFTGSTSGGRQVAQVAAAHLKKTVLELGGSDAYLIFDDADLARAARICAQARLVNGGQSCVAGKRFIVTRKNAPTFVELFISEMRKAILPPMASKKFQERIHQQVQKLQSWGGKTLLGGQLPSGLGAFYPATLVLFEKNQSEIHSEEIFGPVATVVVVDSESEAIAVANSSAYGLGGGIFTQDVQRGRSLAETDLEAGYVVVNDSVKSDPSLPFGGVKDSGYGRELSSFGILEFVNIKSVAVAGD